MQNVLHAFSSCETNSDTRKSQPFVDLSKIKRYYPPVWDNSTLKRFFHCIMRAERCTLVFDLRNNPRHTQIKLNTRFFRKLCVISLPFEIFTTSSRSFLSILHAERTARVFQRRNKPRHTQFTIIYRFCPKLTVISPRLRFLRRLHARFSPFYMQYVLHACSTVDTSPETRKLQWFDDFVEN